MQCRLRFELVVLLAGVHSCGAAQTAAEAVQFITQNSSVKSIDCDSAYTESQDQEFTYASRFDPKSVIIGGTIRTKIYPATSEYSAKCIAGDCIKVAESDKCAAGTTATCKAIMDRLLKTSKDNDTGEWGIGVKNVSIERFKKAWDFYVQSCGGANKSPF